MQFLEWLERETEALAQLDRMERGEIPVGPITFTKRDGTEVAEFVQFTKTDADGSRTTVIANEGGLNLLEAEQSALGLADAVSKAAGQVQELQKRVDALAAERADSVEVTAEQLLGLVGEALDEATKD